MLKKVFLSLLLASLQVNAVIDINGKGINKQSLFIGACKSGNAELIKLLIKDGKIDINAGLPLILDNIEMLKLLIAAGADVNTTYDENNHKCSLISYLDCQKGGTSNDALKLLIAAGVDVNYVTRGYTPLLNALSTSLPDANYIELLINAGANVNATTLSGETALDMIRNQLANCYCDARYYNNAYKIICKLIKAGADVNITKSGHTHSIFILAIHLNQIEIIKLLIAAGVNVNQLGTTIYDISSNGVCARDHTALMIASQKGTTEIVKLLLSISNIDTEITNLQGKTAFDIACETGNEVIIELFQNYYREKSTQKSIVTIENNSENNLNILQSTTVPANSKAIITTEIFEL